MKTSIVLALVAALAIPALADAKPAHRHKRQAVRPPQTPIACTVLGCRPVPPGCGLAAGRTFSGSPTGYDVVVCPPGVQPFR
jgi:hypothetical protein